ncbi:MAG: carboxypeptidase-like regulatory domain-containing protein, partial [Bacteroidota bacterium]
KDNAGNQLVPTVTTTTNASRVIFDETAPLPATDVVDQGGPETTGYKPAADADLYTWTNDTDPAGGLPRARIFQYELRYFNPNTGINEMVTQPRPPQQFAPTAMIPDTDPYQLFMLVRDRAGNASPETLVYTQRYGIEISGKVTDKETGVPLEGAVVNLIAPFGEVCNDLNQEVCSATTDANGDYSVIVQPNLTYTIDVTRIPDYYIAKDTLAVTTVDVVSNVQLQHVEAGDVQTGSQGTLLTTDVQFVAEPGAQPQATLIQAFSFSGNVVAKQTDEGIVITSSSRITQVISNNPEVVIVDQLNNSFLVKNAGTIILQSDNTNSASSVSSSFASGQNRVGIRGNLGGASAG